MVQTIDFSSHSPILNLLSTINDGHFDNYYENHKQFFCMWGLGDNCRIDNRTVNINAIIIKLKQQYNQSTIEAPI